MKEDFGFDHRLWIFSGRRGVHCWVCDPTAREFQSTIRQSIVENLTVLGVETRLDRSINFSFLFALKDRKGDNETGQSELASSSIVAVRSTDSFNQDESKRKRTSLRLDVLEIWSRPTSMRTPVSNKTFSATNSESIGSSDWFLMKISFSTCVVDCLPLVSPNFP